MHVIIEFGDLVGWIIFGISVVVFTVYLVVVLIREKYRQWKKKREDKKGDRQDAGER